MVVLLDGCLSQNILLCFTISLEHIHSGRMPPKENIVTPTTSHPSIASQPNLKRIFRDEDELLPVSKKHKFLWKVSLPIRSKPVTVPHILDQLHKTPEKLSGGSFVALTPPQPVEQEHISAFNADNINAATANFLATPPYTPSSVSYKQILGSVVDIQATRSSLHSQQLLKRPLDLNLTFKPLHPQLLPQQHFVGPGNKKSNVAVARQHQHQLEHLMDLSNLCTTPFHACSAQF